MKKFLFLVVAVLIGCTASAQIVQSTMVRKEKKQRKVVWILRAGFSMNGNCGPDILSHCESSLKAGYELSFGYNLPLGQNGFYWGQELGLYSRGVKYTWDYSDDYHSDNTIYQTKSEENYSGHCAKLIPIQFGYKLKVNDNIKIDAHLGGFGSVTFTSSHKEELFYSDGTSEVDDDPSGQVARDFDGGIHAGLGVWYKRFNLDLAYQKGFVGNGSSKIFNQSFMVRLGVAF